MTIGGAIVLIVIGAVLAFAIEVDIPGVSDDILGYILIAAGIVGLLFALMYRSRATRTTTAYTEPTVRSTPVVEERRVVDDRDRI